MYKHDQKTTVINCDYVGRPHAYLALKKEGYKPEDIFESQTGPCTYCITASTVITRRNEA